MGDDKYIRLTPDLYRYLLAHNPPEDDVLRDLAAETQTLGDIALMQVAREQGALLTLLARLLGTRHAFEIGTFTGYSTICIARGLAPGGRLTTCDVSEEWTAIARRYWTRAGLADRIDLHLAPAEETIAALPTGEILDLVFIDADKTGYGTYYEALLPRVRPGGLVVLDNVLWAGQVVDPAATDEATVAIRAINDRVAADDRVDAVMLPIADGITIARKR